jgi:LmbE family N-acetylglucosaminyl deacetylase
LLLLAALSSCSRAPAASAEAVPKPLPPITSSDRILILAPHEDDEAISTGGVILHALAAGAAVRVVFLTYGDHNQLAFVAYRKTPWVTPAVNRHMGEQRRRESVQGVAALGLSADHLVFLGYPDHDMLDIWREHWGAAGPLHSLLTDAESVPYPDSRSFGAPYKGERILSDLEEQIRQFRPTRVFVSHPADANPDHRAYCLFAQVALWDLAAAMEPPQLLCYPTHFGPWPRPKGYRPDMPLDIPGRLAGGRDEWWSVNLTAAQVRRKYEAILAYKSQLSDGRDFLTSFARRNEIFCSQEPIRLAAVGEGEAPGKAGIPTGETETYESETPSPAVQGVRYFRTDRGLDVEVRLRGSIREELGLRLLAFGYRHDRPFAEMPKIQVERAFGRVAVHDQSRALRAEDVQIREAEHAAVFSIPWDLLGDPERVLAQVHGRAADITVEQTGWQALECGPGGR